MKCTKCNGYGYIDNLEGDGLKCPICNGTGEIGQTEQEYIQTCNTEQLAEFLTKVILDDKRFRMTMVGGVNETKMWLKQPHGGES